MRLLVFSTVALAAALLSEATSAHKGPKLASLVRTIGRQHTPGSNHRPSALLSSDDTPPKNGTQDAGCGDNCQSTLTFASDAAQNYTVGSNIPGIPFQVKTSWAGNMIIGDTNPDSTLFFWLWGAEDEADNENLVIWLNGGPGCSSLMGLLQENGPFYLIHEGDQAQVNPYSWTNAASMLYIEQPVGVGFTTGNANAQSEEDVAEQMGGFLDNFFDTFAELKGKNLWIAGESYAGRYIPAIANFIYQSGNPYNLQGVYIIDGFIADDAIQIDYPAYGFAATNQEILNLTDASLNQIKSVNDQCGYGDFFGEKLQYPGIGNVTWHECAIDASPWETWYQIQTDQNPCYNCYYVVDQCEPPNVLGDGNSDDQANHTTFFDNPDLQNYLNAANQKWNLCNGIPLQTNDTTPDPVSSGVLQYVIESSVRTIIASGDYDGLIMTNGTAMAVQNTMWNGTYGLTAPPSKDLVGVDGDVTGKWAFERGLAFVQHTKAGHEAPEFDRSGSLTMIGWLVGKVASLGGEAGQAAKKAASENHPAKKGLRARAFGHGLGGKHFGRRHHSYH